MEHPLALALWLLFVVVWIVVGFLQKGEPTLEVQWQDDPTTISNHYQ
jgi:hypothetical protein